MSDILAAIYKSRRARLVSVQPPEGAAFEARAIFEDEPGRVWEKTEPRARFLVPVTVSAGAAITLVGTGATFKVYDTDTEGFGRETVARLERLADVFDDHNAVLYRSSRACDGLLTGSLTATVRAILERQESVRGLDYGRARDVLVARIPAAMVPAAPQTNDLMTLIDGRVFRLYGIEPLYRGGEYRLVLET